MMISSTIELDELLSKTSEKKYIGLLTPEANDFVSQNLENSQGITQVLYTNSEYNLAGFREFDIKNFVNLQRVNDVRLLNKFFEEVNRNIPAGGIFIGCLETSEERKRRILNKYHWMISYPRYTTDFVIKRVFPKWGPTRKINHILTRGNNRVLSLPEVLGRLISCGFEIISHKEIANMTYFAVKKIKEPGLTKDPSFGAIFKMKRIGKEGKTIYVYKMRTMHPYSEYLQDYIYKLNSLAEGGKFKDDFRITNWGKLFRRLWIDEIPMIINWMRRDLKIVGVRPLSSQYLNLYTRELREKRLKYKPGLIPPYYADMPKTLTEIMESEMRYLEAYENNPIATDFKYFAKAFVNIIFRNARSK